MVFPSENLHCACAGGLGRLLLSCADEIRQSAKIVKAVTVAFFSMTVSFEMIQLTCVKTEFSCEIPVHRLDYLWQRRLAIRALNPVWYFLCAICVVCGEDLPYTSRAA